MYSLAFPEMFAKDGTRTMLLENHEATFSNLRLVLLSTKNSLLGDPDFGSLLKRKLFEQNTPILQDLVIDDIYTTILTFMPQISLKRSDIKVTSDGVDLFVTIQCTNLIDYELDTYTINLTTESV
jgi:phage baseplate assembly protein W